MIITVTLNAALDKTVRVDELLPGRLNRLKNVETDPSGKGINVSRVLHAFGEESLATGFLGGGTGAGIREALDTAGIANDFVMIAGETRTNTKVIDAGGAVTELNEPGPAVTGDELNALRAKLGGIVRAGDLVIFSGSVPVGVSTDIYRELTLLVKAKGARVFLDSDRDYLRLGLEAEPDLIKPNRAELCALAGLPEDAGLPRLLSAARSLIGRGVGTVVVSLGADGAMFISRSAALFCPAPAVVVKSPIGAGDTMLAALAVCSAKAIPPEASAVFAVAAASAATMTYGTRPPEIALVEKLKLGLSVRAL